VNHARIPRFDPMSKTNKNDSNKAAVLARVEKLRIALQAEPPAAAKQQAIEQLDRLQRAISQFHAEGLRFAVFTLLRLINPRRGSASQPVQQATHDLKSALEMAGYPH
jgi:hypothetical protein